MKHSYIIGAVMVVLMAVVFFIGIPIEDPVGANPGHEVKVEFEVGTGDLSCTKLPSMKPCKKIKKPHNIKAKRVISVTYLLSNSCYVCWEGDCYAC